MKKFNNFSYMILNPKTGNASVGNGGVRTYKTLKAAQKQLGSYGGHYYEGCVIVQVFYAEVVA